MMDVVEKGATFLAHRQWTGPARAYVRSLTAIVDQSTGTDIESL